AHVQSVRADDRSERGAAGTRGLAACGAGRGALGAGSRGLVRFGLLLVFGSFQFGAAPERAAQSADDRWLARDKAYHFVASAVIQSATHSALRAAGSPYPEASV